MDGTSSFLTHIIVEVVGTVKTLGPCKNLLAPFNFAASLLYF